ncbi:hypothetical protein [Alienimonas sp. DA493]|uniref:hypothetical protein n=1 Tax=Alienimonas sp. DA493 TaxID=3373605 RepID=UPI003754C44D
MNPPDCVSWAALSAGEKAAFGRRLAAALPTGFAFADVARHELGDVAGETARFTGPGGRAWAFVPGGEARLGFDASTWTPTAAEAESWARTAEDFDLAPDPAARVAEVVTPVRTAVLPPLLVEAAATELGWEPADLGDPDVQEALRSLDEARPGAREITAHRGDSAVRVRAGKDGALTAHRAGPLTPEGLSRTVRAEGFRFPTDDEWERLCGGGATTLWRWGDHVPDDRYPTEVSPAEAAWQREWALSGGTLERPAEGFQSDWDLHRRPNALGLHIAEDPYQREVVEGSAGVVVGTRGGDGGCAICGGEGFLAGWLPLATAWREPFYCGFAGDAAPTIGYTFGRRVLELG